MYIYCPNGSLCIASHSLALLSHKPNAALCIATQWGHSYFLSIFDECEWNAKQNIIHFLDCGKLSFRSLQQLLFVSMHVIVVHFCAPFKTNWQSYKFKLNVLVHFSLFTSSSFLSANNIEKGSRQRSNTKKTERERYSKF